MTTHTYWASIGRNIGTEPMADADWARFCDETRRVAALWGSVITTAAGTSTWQDDNEDAFLVLFTIEEDTLDALRYSLRNLARTYGQDAIGLVGGPGESLIHAQL